VSQLPHESGVLFKQWTIPTDLSAALGDGLRRGPGAGQYLCGRVAGEKMGSEEGQCGGCPQDKNDGG
jgi:hypothetical protein